MHRLLPALLLILMKIQEPAKFPDTLSREALKDLKAATVLIEIRGLGPKLFGSGFLISADGYILTNKHVVEPRPGGTPEIYVLLNSGTEAQKSVKAEKVLVSQDSDLALVKIEGTSHKFVHFADAGDLTETVTVWALGFPLGGAFGEGAKGPDITINKGSVTALRKSSGGGLEFIQIDSQVNPGNSGGPLVAGDGRVYGVITFAIRESSLRFAIPSSTVAHFLEPKVLTSRLKPARIPVTGGKVEIETQIHHTAFEADDVHAIVEMGDQAIRCALRKGESSKGTTTWSGTWDCPEVTPANLQRLEMIVVFKDKSKRVVNYRGGPLVFKSKTGEVTIAVEDGVEFKPGEKEGEDRVTTSKEVQEGQLQLSSIDTGTEKIPVRQIESARFVKVTRSSLDVRVSLKSAGRVIFGPTSRLNVSKPETAEGREEQPLAEGEAIEKRLPGPVHNVKLAGGGSLMILHFRTLRTLGVFDVRKAEMVKHISLPDGEVEFAAGLRHLLICHVEQSRTERWNLETLTRETMVESPFQGKVVSLEMGWESEGPAVAMVEAHPRGSCSIVLIDPARTKLLELQFPDARGRAPTEPSFIRVNSWGTHFTWWKSNSSSGAGMCRIEEARLAGHWLRNTGDYALPSEDGSLVFTSIGCARFEDFSQDQRRDVEATGPTIPSASGPFYLQLKRPSSGVQGGDPVRGSVHLLTNRARVASLDFPIIDRWIPGTHDTSLTMDRRIWFLNRENVLVTLPASNDRLVCQSLNIEKLLEKTEVDYLFVSSVAPHSGFVGQKWTYPMKVRSSAGGVRIKPEGMPEGMKLQDENVLEWIPKEPGPTTVVLRVSDASGQEVYHTFRVRVR